MSIFPPTRPLDWLVACIYRGLINWLINLLGKVNIYRSPRSPRGTGTPSRPHGRPAGMRPAPCPSPASLCALIVPNKRRKRANELPLVLFHMQKGCIWSHNASLHHCGVSEMPICRWLLVSCVLSAAIIAESPEMDDDLAEVFEGMAPFPARSVSSSEASGSSNQPAGATQCGNERRAH